MIQFTEPVDGKYHGQAVVLSGTVLHNRKLGHFQIDLLSLVYHKERVPVDYNHDPNIVIGYAENFRVTEMGLVADIYLMEGVTKVQEITALIKGGTPFEISPSINEEEGLCEIADGVSIYKNVPLRGVAVCPFGTDRFTNLTLLKETMMPTQQNASQTVTKTTNLAADTGKGEAPETKIKDPDLKEFCEVYGTEKGLELWQSGADINDIRKMKELIDKYGVPGKPEPANPSGDAAQERGALAPSLHNEPAEDKEKTDLKTVVTGLKSEIVGLKAEVTKLSAAVPRGESAPVHHNYETGEKQKELSEKEQYLHSFNKRFKNR